MTPSSTADDGSEERGRRVATIERAADVLFLFTQDERPTLGVTEIADELNISKAVVHLRSDDFDCSRTCTYCGCIDRMRRLAVSKKLT